MNHSEQSNVDFRHTQQFAAGEVVGTLGLGPHERHYEELFAEVLADGVITPEERVRLNEAADSLGLDRAQLMRLETAMLDAYQARHNVEVVEHYQKPTPSLIPPDFQAEGDATHAMLLGEIERLRARVGELEEALRRAQAAINVEVQLEQPASVIEPTARDPETCWRRVRRDPTNPDVLRALYAAYDARAEADKCWCVAQALVALDRATPDERRVFEAGATEGLIAPKASVGPDAWVELLMHPEQDVLTGRIFGLIAPAVVLGRVSALRHEGKLYQPDPSNRQDPAMTTIMAVRALPWAAAILGIATPPVFTEKAREADYEHIPGIPGLVPSGTLRQEAVQCGAEPRGSVPGRTGHRQPGAPDGRRRQAPRSAPRSGVPAADRALGIGRSSPQFLALRRGRWAHQPPALERCRRKDGLPCGAARVR
jgi:hypothetical protein